MQWVILVLVNRLMRWQKNKMQGGCRQLQFSFRLQSKMRHSKNNSSICDTTTLLSMSNVSASSSDWPSFPTKYHDQLTQKAQELELILQTTLAQGTMLDKRHHQLLASLAQRKTTLAHMQRNAVVTEPDCSQDQMAETYRMNFGWKESRDEHNFARTIKNHQKFYSAIQSPSANHSPERNYDHFTLHSYQKSRYDLSTASNKSGIIRKQRGQLRMRDTPSYLSPRQRDFDTIEDIWNGGTTRREEKPTDHKSIKSFL